MLILISILLLFAQLFCGYNLFIGQYRLRNYDRIIKKMHAAMWGVAKQEYIPIFIKKEDEMYAKGQLCAGLYHSPMFDGHYTNYGFRYIYILEKFKDDPWVLAHELGHHFAIKNEDDYSEVGADRKGKGLVKDALSLFEYLSMIKSINIYFGKVK
jgi:hypothetical protein